MFNIMGCKFCEENKCEKIKSIKIIYEYENPESTGYPEIAFWKREYDTVRCPMCGRIIKQLKV